MRILLAENRTHVRWALRTAIAEQRGLSVVGEIDRGETLLAQAATLRPDLVLLDWELPGPPATGLLQALQENDASLRVIVLSIDSDVGGAALAAGADAFVCKTDPPERLLAALRGVRHRPVPAGEGDVLAHN